MATLAEIATPARGTVPPPADKSEDDGEEGEVFFKGKAMIVNLCSAEKENQVNVPTGSPVQLPGSPLAGKLNTPTSSTPAGSSKKRPKPLEHVLAAKSLAGAGGSPAGARPSRPRDSWVFADIVETPVAGSPTLSSRESILSAVVGGCVSVKPASPRGKPRESILAFSAMSPLAPTPTSEAGIFGTTFQSRGLFADRLPLTTGTSVEAADTQASDVPRGGSREEDGGCMQADPAAEKPEQEQPVADQTECAKGKKRKDSILWFNDLSKQGE